MEIVCSDGYKLAADWYAAQGSSRGCIVISPATGLRRSYYAAFAQFLSRSGWDVICFDNRGIGDSAQGSARVSAARMRDWGQLDIDAALQSACASQQNNWQRVTLIGHSSGGHLAGLAPALSKINRLILIASGTCNWRLYPFSQKPRVLAAWWLLMPALLTSLGYLPARFGVGVDLPAGVAWDWRNWSLGRDYLFSDASLDSSGYARFAGQVIALSFTDDRGFSPPRTVSDLLRRFTLAAVSHQEIAPMRGNSNQHIGHFGFFKAGNELLWESTLGQLLAD
jgi:predicted alpha/beta hydrolase